MMFALKFILMFLILVGFTVAAPLSMFLWLYWEVFCQRVTDWVSWYLRKPRPHFESKFPPPVHKYDDRCEQCGIQMDGWIQCDRCDIAACSHKCIAAHQCPGKKG